MGVRVERLNRWVWWCGRRGKMLRRSRGRGRGRVGGDGDGNGMGWVVSGGVGIRRVYGAATERPAACRQSAGG